MPYRTVQPSPPITLWNAEPKPSSSFLCSWCILYCISGHPDWLSEEWVEGDSYSSSTIPASSSSLPFCQLITRWRLFSWWDTQVIGRKEEERMNTKQNSSLFPAASFRRWGGFLSHSATPWLSYSNCLCLSPHTVIPRPNWAKCTYHA